MNQQPDNLFRSKLENFQLKAPANAWSRIEAGLDQKSNKGLWLKIAAGFALISVATVLIWNQTPKEENASLASHTQLPIESTDQNETTPVAANESELPVQVKKNDGTPKQKSTRTKNKTSQAEKPVDIQIAQVVVEPQLSEPSPSTALVEVPESALPTESMESQAGVYLVYTAEEVNKKYLLAQPEDDATSEAKKTSRLHMLMGVANNLKNVDNGFADIRQMKDEIFALNFIDEKKRQQKKNN